MWITVDVERVLRVDRGINVILCNPMLGSGGPQTLVLKLKGSEMTDELQRLRSALEGIADWRNVNISGEYEHGLRDIIRSIIDSAVDALDSPTQRPAPQAAPTRDGIAKVIQSHVMMRSRGSRSMEIFGFEEAADAILALSRPAPQDYSAWLIETDEGASINYFQLVDDDDWTFDHNKAVHFGRKQDAEKVVAYYGWTRARAVEHMWPTLTHPAPQAPAGSDVAVCAECGVNWGTTTARKFGIDNYCSNCESRRGAAATVRGFKHDLSYSLTSTELVGDKRRSGSVDSAPLAQSIEPPLSVQDVQQEFYVWWAANQEDPAHGMITQNCALATWKGAYDKYVRKASSPLTSSEERRR